MAEPKATNTEQQSRRLQHPCECPNCGGSIDYATNSSNGNGVTLCRGECGEWTEFEA